MSPPSDRELGPRDPSPIREWHEFVSAAPCGTTPRRSKSGMSVCYWLIAVAAATTTPYFVNHLPAPVTVAVADDRRDESPSFRQLDQDEVADLVRRGNSLSTGAILHQRAWSCSARPKRAILKRR